MEQKIEQESKKEEVKAEIKVEEVSPIEEAKKVMEENKKLLAEMQTERKRIEKATAEMLVNGRSYAGDAQKKKTEEELKKEGALEFFKGSEIEKALIKYG